MSNGHRNKILGIGIWVFSAATLCYANEEIFYVYSGGQKVAKIENKIGEGEEVISYLVNDSLGSPRVILDKTEQAVWSSDYEPFGKAILRTPPNGVAENKRFTGKEYDEETGLHYYGARYYDSNLGRFISPDLAGQSNSPYVYTDNNPLVRVDPDGNWWWNKKKEFHPKFPYGRTYPYSMREYHVYNDRSPIWPEIDRKSTRLNSSH